MISLVHAILKNARDDQEEALRQIDEGKSFFNDSLLLRIVLTCGNISRTRRQKGVRFAYHLMSTFSLQ